MGVEPFLVAAVLRGVLGQRLVRRLCERCRQPDPDAAEIVASYCQHQGVAEPTEQGYFKTGGCAACGQTGFRGRVGVFEVLRVDGAIRRLIGDKADSGRLLAAGRANGLTTMVEDGFSKASRGLTTVDEVLRTTG